MDEKYRMDSTTDVEDDAFDDTYDKERRWRSSPVEEKPSRLRFSFGHASHMDDPYRKIPARSGTIGMEPPQFQEYSSNDVPWQCGDPYRYAAPKQEKNSWQKCRKLVDKYDDEMCAAWKEEVDKLLIFAGLFSATITAFTVESYKWLEEEPDDATAQLIAYLTAQLTKDAGPLPPSIALKPFTVSKTEVRINAVWFLSLTLSLTTVLIGILCLQWLREYQRDGTLPHKDAIALRQMRFEGLIFWRVPEILSLLPLLLQISLVLFFFGLLDLLWARHTAVAACVTVAVGLVLLFMSVTTVLPTLQHALSENTHLRIAQSPYKSPQSWLFYRFSHGLFHLVTRIMSAPNDGSTRFYRLLKSTADTDWLAFDMRWRRLRDASAVVRGAPKDFKDRDDLHDALYWLNSTFTQNIEAVYPLHSCLTSSRDMDVDSAEEAITRMYEEVGLNMDVLTFKVMLDDRYAPGKVTPRGDGVVEVVPTTLPNVKGNAARKREIVRAFYLHLHAREVHREILWEAYVEAVVRILNTQDVPEPFRDWLTEILIELSGRVVGAGGKVRKALGGQQLRRSGEQRRAEHTSIHGTSLPRAVGDRDSKKRPAVDEEEEVVVVQVLMCVRGLIMSDVLRVLDVVMTWNLMYYLLYGFSDCPQTNAFSSLTNSGGIPDGMDTEGTAPGESKEAHRLSLVLSIVDALVGWLERGKERDRWERVKVCAEGVLKVFPAYVLTPSIISSPSRYGAPFIPPGLEDEVDIPIGGAGDNHEDEDRLGEGHDGMMSVVKLIRTLDDHMLGLGGAPVVLQREKWWHEFWDSRYSSEDWKALLGAVADYM